MEGSKSFQYEWLSNPEIFEVNRLEAHSDHRYYMNHKEAAAGKSSYIKSLNGSWKFSFAMREADRIHGFETADFDCKSWADINVPEHMEMAGYGVPQYVNAQYPWDGHEDVDYGNVPEMNPVGSYVRYFSIPEQWKGKRVRISFQGVQAALAVWLNGVFLGYGEDSFTPSDYDLTDALKDGENKLAVLVYKYASGSWLEDQDYWRLSGIFRDVFLYCCPELHVRDLGIQTSLSEDMTEAVVTLELDYLKTEGAEAVVEVVCLDAEGKKAASAEAKTVKQKQTIKLRLDHVTLWSAEQPYLYELELTIRDAEGQVKEIVKEKLGIRQFEMKDGLMKINGKRIVFRGANRHEFSSIHGRAVTYDEMLTDVINMKQNNINAVRTSHYPNHSDFYRLCDEYGIYLIDEANLETHGTWCSSSQKEKDCLPGDRSKWLQAVVDRAKSMLMRDRNHASVLIWSCGNESFGGRNIYKMSEFFHKADPSRLVHYEGIVHDRRYNETSDMESQMYTSAANIEKFLEKHPEKPFICCEYSHAMGNSSGALHKYMELADRNELFQGAFIWDYIDQAIAKKDRYGREFMAYGGDFGDRPCDYNFCTNGIVYADRKNSPKMQTVKYNYQSIEIRVDKTTAVIRNKALFTDVSEYDGLVQLKRDGVLIDEQSFSLSLAPLSQTELTLPVKEQKEPGEYTVTVSFLLSEDTLWAKKGYEVAFGEGVYKVAAKKKVPAGTLMIADSLSNFGVRGENFEVLFSRGGQGIASYRYMGKEFISSTVCPNFWRAPIDNDRGNGLPARSGQWKLASLYQKVVNCESSSTKKQAKMVYELEFATIPVTKATLTYTVTPDGRVQVDLDYKKTEGMPEMPEFAVMMKLPADYNQLSWYGYGPEETYVDRITGAKLGIYHNQVTDNLSGYVFPQECGNHTGVRYAEVTDETGFGLRFEADSTMDFSALPYTPHELECAEHIYELPQIHNTVVRASLKQMGVGGDDSWGSWTHEEYRLKNEDMHFTFSFFGVKKD